MPLRSKIKKINKHVYIRKIHNAFSHELENKILFKLTPKVGRVLNADQLTLIAFIGAIWMGIWIFLSGWEISFLIISLFGLFMHWFGDGLDGKVAAYRGESRPKYGYYIDRMLDALSISIVLLSIHISSLTVSNAWLYLTIIILLLTTHVYLKASVTLKFEMQIERIGGLELKMFSVLLAIVTVLSGNPFLSIYQYNLKLLDVIGFIILTLSTVIFTKLVLSSVLGKKRIKD